VKSRFAPFCNSDRSKRRRASSAATCTVVNVQVVYDGVSCARRPQRKRSRDGGGTDM
jgi:hypothetical protein